MRAKKGSRPEDPCLYCREPIGLMGLVVCPCCRKTKCVARCIPLGNSSWCLDCETTRIKQKERE